MKRDLEPLRKALPMMTLCEREGMVFKRSAGNFVARCPFHEGGRASFTIHSHDLTSAHCYNSACNWNGDIFKFFSEKRGLSLIGKGFGEVADQLSSLCGILPPRPDAQFSAAPPKRRIPLSILEESPPQLPDLEKFKAAHAKDLAKLRGYDLDGLREAVRRGYLHFAYWPVDKQSAQPDSRSRASWCITDGSRRVAQFRRMDGHPYSAGMKAWSTKGARWLVGCEDVGPETELVLLVEGGADFLAAWTLIARAAAQNVAVCCVFGGTVHIAPECRAMLRGKRVRIIMDVDAPKATKRGKKELQLRAGTEAAARWSAELTDCGAIVDVYSLEGLTCIKDGETRPVGDLNDLLLMKDPDQIAIHAAQILTPAPVSDPLPGETTSRIGTVRHPAPDTAAEFFPSPPPPPEPAPPTPHIPEEETVPAPHEPTLAEILAANERREYEKVIQKHRAGQLLTTREKALIKRMENSQENIAAPPDSGLPPEEFIEQVCRDLDVWWVNGGGSVFQVGNGSQWREVPQQALVTMLQKRGISDRAVSGSLVTQTSDSIVHIMDNRILNKAIDGLAGFRKGIHQIKDMRVLIRRGPFIIEPKEGDCELILTVLMGLLGLDGVEGAASMIQFEMLLYWLSRAAGNIHTPGPVHLNNQVVMIAGPAGAGKSLIQHAILTPMLGGRSADPSLYLFGESNFNDGWAHCEHLLIEDPRPNVRTHDRLLFAQKLKGLVVNPEHTVHYKHEGEFNAPNRHCTSITVNDDPDSIRILPKLTPDFMDKVMLFKMRDYPLPMPVRRAEDKAAFQEAITAQMPAFLHYVLNLEVPEHLHDPKQRFNVKSYINPDMALLLSDDSPESELLALLDHSTIKLSEHALERTLWETDSAHDAVEYLEKRPQMRASQPFLVRCEKENRRVWIGTSLDLHDVMQNSRNTAAWKKVADHNQLSRLLGRLAEDRNDRVCAYRTNSARMWFISAPDLDPEG